MYSKKDCSEHTLVLAGNQKSLVHIYSIVLHCKLETVDNFDLPAILSPKKRSNNWQNVI